MDQKCKHYKSIQIPTDPYDYLLIGQKEYPIIQWTNQRQCMKTVSWSASLWSCDSAFSKLYHNWFNKWIFDDFNQSEIVLEGQYRSAQGVNGD